MKKEGDSVETSMPRFFRIFNNKSCQEHLELPLAFKSFLAKPMPERVTIRNQRRENWSITIKSVKNKVFLENGWKSFAQQNELKHGNCLIFTYNGDNVFDVTIFDCSALEKFKSSHHVVETNEIEETDEIDDDDDEQEEADDVREEKISKSQRRKVKGGQNPSFITKLTGKRKSQLRIPSYVVKDYNLRFNNSVILFDSFGKLKRDVAKWRDNQISIKSFGSIINRNYAKPNDKLICEIITERKVWVRAIKFRHIHG